MENSYFKEPNTLGVFTTPINFPPHVHEMIEILCVVKGSGTAYCNGKAYPLSEGSVFLTFPNQVHYYENFPKNCIGLAAHIPINYINDFEETYYMKEPQSNAIAPEHFEKIVQLLNVGKEFSSVEDPLVIKGIANSVFYILASQFSFISSTDQIDKVLQIITYCSTHFKEDIKISDISKALFISPSTISRAFSNKLNISFNDYINSLRISYFLTQMPQDKSSITRTALSAGFDNLRTFNRAFKKLYGVTPKAYLLNQTK